VDKNTGLTHAVRAGQKDTAKYLISQGANNLDECLKIACEKENFEMTQLLVESGAKTVVGLRVTKSPNIQKLLYRYEQNSETITF
jgi:ankyrin repeat protein